MTGRPRQSYTVAMSRHPIETPDGAPVSVIIPTLNAADTLGPCLGALGEAVMDGVIRELILVDGGSEDAIEAVADDVGAVFLKAPRGRGSQLAAGARIAQGSWLLFLHADSVLGVGWAAAIRAHMQQTPDRAGYFRVRFQSEAQMARITAGWANLRARVFGLPYGDQGLLISRTAYDAIGGFPEIPLMEDVALVRRLPRRPRAIPVVIETSAERFERNGWIARGAGNLWRLVRYLLGASPERLAQRYDR
ncbi:MAG: TIGR04283 family arsenosugar biosynthesis glycosyltransferase [Pseudomonadota bacterium]